MRYHLESYLPVEAFKPRGGVGGMTLHGGGGGVISAVTDTISNALGTAGGESGILGGLADFDDAVATSVDGGWAGLAEQAAVIAATAVGGPLGGAAARGAFDYTHGGEDRENALRNAAEQAAVSTAGNYFGPIGAGATKAGFQYTHGGKDRENALQSGLIAAGSQMATQAAKDYFSSSDIEAPVTDKSDYIYSPESRDFDYISDEAVRDFDTTDISSNDLPLYEANINDLGAGTSPYGEANELPRNELAKDPFRDPRPGFFQDPIQNITNRASDALDYAKNAPKNTLDYFTDPNRTVSDMGSDLYGFAGRNLPAIGLGALALSRMGGQQPQPQPSPAGYSSEYSPYTGGYGSSGGVADPYLLRNRVTASNVYDYENPYDRYGTVNRRYAKGGEVKHFFLGGITNTLKNVLPYAGIFAAPFISNPAAAAGIGALSSGFGGRSGSNFDMKRALMGGIAAYGASTIGAGLQAAGTTPTISPSEAQLTAATEGIAGTTPPLTEAVSKPFFRDTDAMQKGVGNLLSSDSDAASKAFSTQAGTFKSGVPLVMGISGMTAIDEANKMREEAERSAGVGRQEQADMLARIAKGRKRAEEAVRSNPYMYAMGGSVDDEMGGDYSAMGMDQGNMQRGLFGLGYAAGGMPNLALSRLSQPAFNEGAVGGMQQFATGGTPRFLSGGGDGMSDSIPATIGGTQEARLADGEFVIPADVVSHLGNGSSKAGAKQLYSMMDRVRKARTGNEKQGRQIKPNKMMPA